MPLSRTRKRLKAREEPTTQPRRVYKRWLPGEKERMVALYTSRPAGMTLAEFTAKHHPECTPKNIGQVIYETKRKARVEEENQRSSPATSASSSATTASASVTTVATVNSPLDSSAKLRKRRTPFIQSDDEEEEVDSSADEQIEDITISGDRAPNKCIKLSYGSARSRLSLDNSQETQDRGRVHSEVAQRSNKATPVSSPRMNRSETMPFIGNNNRHLDPRRNRQNQSDSPPISAPPPPPTTQPSPTPPPPPTAASSIATTQHQPPVHYSPPPQEKQLANHGPVQQKTVEKGHTQQLPEHQHNQTAQGTLQDEARGTVADLRKFVAQQFTEFHRQNQEHSELLDQLFNQFNRQQYAKYSQTIEMLFALNQEKETKCLNLEKELSEVQKRHDLMQAEKNLQISRLQDEINSWQSERESVDGLRKEHALLTKRYDAMQKALVLN